jgi:hypothetical protein
MRKKREITVRKKEIKMGRQKHREWVGVNKKFTSITFPPAIWNQIEQQGALVSGTLLFR